MTTVRVSTEFLYYLCQDDFPDYLTRCGISLLHPVFRMENYDSGTVEFRQHPKWRVFHWPYEWLPPFDTKDAVFRAYFRKGGER
jgi:hypothetical protein